MCVCVYVYVCMLCVGVCLGLWAVSLSPCMQWCSRQAVEKEDETKEKKLGVITTQGGKVGRERGFHYLHIFCKNILAADDIHNEGAIWK